MDPTMTPEERAKLTSEDAREHDLPKAEVPPKAIDVSPEFADRMRQRRPGYDNVHFLVRQYDKLSTDELELMADRGFVEFFVRSLFEALGWSVTSGGGMGVATTVPTPISSLQSDLALAFRDLRIPVQVYKSSALPSNHVENRFFSHIRSGDAQWGILTNFERILIFDLRDYESPSVKLETSPWAYVTDGDEKHDILAAEIFYERMSGADTEVGSTGKPQPEKAQPAGPGHVSIPPRVASDAASGRLEDDLLGFEDYAAALYQFIKYRRSGRKLVERYVSVGQSTNTADEPLAIGIEAGWGMGKTTLMKMIRQHLDQSRDSQGKRDFLTVWFDAWQFDEEEALWAALVLTILKQVSQQAHLAQRLQLGLGLPFQRIDWGLVLRSLLMALASLVAIALAVGLIWNLGVSYLSPELLKQINTFLKDNHESLTPVIGRLGIIAILVLGVRFLLVFLTRPFATRIGEFLREPDYNQRVGFLNEFRQDFERVVTIATRNGKREMVVFIDDLDRCSPPKPVEIIEAINVLLDAEHCVFVVGIDAAMVSCSIEAKYKDLGEHLATINDPTNLPLGRRFLEKIFQITFRIPAAPEEALAYLAEATLTGAPSEFRHPGTTRESISEIARLVQEEQQRGVSIEEAMEAVVTERGGLDEEARVQVQREVFAASFEELEEVRQAILGAIPYLGSNPRKVKRFMNLFRLQAFIANQRGLVHEVIHLPLLANWLVLTIRQPGLIEAISSEPDFLNRLWVTCDLLDQIEASGLSEGLRDRRDRGLADPRIAHLMAAPDVLGLLTETCPRSATRKFWAPYLLLTQATTSRSP